EAMIISDEIIVMNRGRIEQQGDARTLYSRPASAFVANFIGVANLVRGVVVAEETAPSAEVASSTGLRVRLALGEGRSAELHAASVDGQGSAPGGAIHLLIRPEDIATHR